MATGVVSRQHHQHKQQGSQSGRGSPWSHDIPNCSVPAVSSCEGADTRDLATQALSRFVYTRARTNYHVSRADRGGTHISKTIWRPCGGAVSCMYCVNPAAAGTTPRSSTHVNLQLRPVRVLDGGVIALDPLLVHELGCLFRVSWVYMFNLGRGGGHTGQAALAHAA